MTAAALAAALAVLAQAATPAPPAAPDARTFHGAPVAADEAAGLAHLRAAERAAAAPAPDRTAAAAAELDAALAALPRDTPLRWATQCLRASAGVGDEQAAGDECLRHYPDQPGVLMRRALAAFVTGESGTGATLVATVLRRHPEIGERLEPATTDGWLRQLDYDRLAGERAALVAALAGSRFGADDPGARSAVLREAALDRLATDDATGARTLADQVLDPADLLQMLVDRRYAALWPAVAAAAGPGLEGARERFVATARAAYEARPDAGRRRMLAGVLERTGHADEALAALRATLAEPAGPGRDDWYHASAAVRVPHLLARAGGGDADALLAPMRAELAGGTVADHPELGNVVPNLALAQIALGRPADALATLDRYPLGTVESPAAGAFVLAIRACALHRLGREAEAGPLLVEVAGAFASNAEANTIATNCAGDADARARAWIARVRDPGQRAVALVAMARARQPVDPTADPLDPGRDALRPVAARRDVAAAFAAFGRAPGPGYAAALGQWRARR